MTYPTNFISIYTNALIRKQSLLSIKGKVSDTYSLNESDVDIIVYLPSPANSFYQLEQWLAPLSKLNEKHKVAILTRKITTFTQISSKTTLPIFFFQWPKDLKKAYQRLSPSIVLYVNNSLKNNRSLLYKKGYHIYLNHGDSEKECMSSNQSKAYDYVFTTGQRAINRYKENLLNFDAKKYLLIGRPQLDATPPLNINGGKTKILYAPTWEAHYSEMDYCSLEQYGLKIVSAILSSPDFQLIYKPHPLIGTKRRSVLQIHRKILSRIKQSNSAIFFSNIDINRLFSEIDFAIFDNSSVMVDYLYFNKPAVYIPIRHDIQTEYLIKAFTPLKQTDLNNFPNFVENCLTDDNKEQRKKIKEHYLGAFKRGESTHNFVTTINNLIKARDEELPTKTHSNSI